MQTYQSLISSKPKISSRLVSENGKLNQRPITTGQVVKLYNYGEQVEVPVLSGFKYNKLYLQRIYEIFTKALNRHRRVFHVRVDLRYPPKGAEFPVSTSSIVITKFFESLKARLKVERRRRKEAGARYHETDMLYFWANEFGELSEQYHYHVVLIFNADTYRSMGFGRYQDQGLFHCINEAWLSAICLHGRPNGSLGLVHVPSRSSGIIKRGDSESLNSALQRSSYLAKTITKVRGRTTRSFGTSRI